MLVLKAKYQELLERYNNYRANHDLLVNLLSEERKKIQGLLDEIEYWKRRADEEREYYRRRTEAENPHNLERLKAIMDLTDEDEPPVPGAVPRAGLMDRINEIYGDGLSVEEMVARRKAYEEAQES